MPELGAAQLCVQTGLHLLKFSRGHAIRFSCPGSLASKTLHMRSNDTGTVEHDRHCKDTEKDALTWLSSKSPKTHFTSGLQMLQAEVSNDHISEHQCCIMPRLEVEASASWERYFVTCGIPSVKSGWHGGPTTN